VAHRARALPEMSGEPASRSSDVDVTHTFVSCIHERFHIVE
jgi:hypothetical protein